MENALVLKYFAAGVAIGLPVLVTFAETIGWVAEVDGKSMRVRISLVRVCDHWERD